MNTKFWDDRYAEAAYVYGEEPNQFFHSTLQAIDVGSILLPAEGEGRNAVYAAELGWEVDAFDRSVEGKKKATLLADKRNVKINYSISDFENFEASPNAYDSIALIYAHLPTEKRKAYYQQCVGWLKVGGTLIFEAFSKNQLGKSSGGPKNKEMLFSLEELESDLAGLTFNYAKELDIQLSEGAYHEGMASVIRLIATKEK